MSEPNDLSEYDDALAKEYGTFRAVVAINYNGARAYNPGDPVPVSNVEAHGYLADGLVEKVEQATEPVSPSPSPSPSPGPLTASALPDTPPVAAVPATSPEGH